MIGLRLLTAALVAGLSVASAAAPLFAPRNDPADTERAAQLHDAHAAGLTRLPGQLPATAKALVFAAAASPVAPARPVIWQNGRLVDLRKAPAGAGRPLPRGGVNALIRVNGLMADIGNVASTRPYRLGPDIQLLPMVGTAAADDPPLLETVPANATATAPWTSRLLASAVALLASAALMIVVGKLLWRMPVKVAPAPALVSARAIPPVRRPARPVRAPQASRDGLRRRRA